MKYSKFIMIIGLIANISAYGAAAGAESKEEAATGVGMGAGAVIEAFNPADAVKFNAGTSVPTMQMWLAIHRGKMEELRNILATMQPDVNSTAYSYVNYQTPLAYAVDTANLDLLNLLLANGANPAKVLHRGGNLAYPATALHQLALSRNRQVRENPAPFIHALVSKNRDILDTRDNKGLTPLMIAVKFKMPRIVEALLREGASINIKDIHGQNVFAVAGQIENLAIRAEILKLLTDYREARRQAIAESTLELITPLKGVIGEF